MGNFLTVILYIAGLLIITGFISCIIYVIASKLIKIKVIPLGLAITYVIYSHIYVAGNDENDELLKTAAIISLVIAITLITSYIIIHKKISKEEAKKKEMIITEYDLKKGK